MIAANPPPGEAVPAVARVYYNHPAMTNRILLSTFAAMMTLSLGCVTAADKHPPTTVAHVDLSRYAGHWYEIARFPKFYEKGCADSTADYTPLPDGQLKVVNACVKDGKVHRVEGTARVVDRVSNAKLIVKFGWAKGDYWIFALDQEYSAALVGTPDLKSLWVLSRTPAMSGQRYEALLHIASEKGFDTSKLRQTPQSQRGQ